MTFDAKQFRDAMARLGSAVCVVTSDGPAGRCGLTCTATCSVTDSPPTILVCINRRSALNPVILRNGAFCLNVLRSGHEDLSDQFAGHTRTSMEERFRLTGWVRLRSGAPAFADAACAVDCVIADAYECGTHTVVFGAVQEIRLHALSDTLVYCNRVYHMLPAKLEAAA